MKYYEYLTKIMLDEECYEPCTCHTYAHSHVHINLRVYIQKGTLSN